MAISGSDPPQPQPARSRRGHGRSAPLSRPAMSPDPIAAESRSYATSSERLFRSGAPPVRCRTAPFPARRPRLICAPAASPDGSTGPPCAITRRSTIARRSMLRSKAGRRCLPPSPISTAISPASSAPGSIHGGPTKAPLADPRRALGHLLGNGVRFGKAGRHPRRRRRRRDHAGTQIGAALIARHCRALGQPPRRPRSAPCRSAPPLCRPRQRRGRSPGGAKGCANAASPPVSKSASSCRSMATSTSISAVSAPRACGRISRISSSPPTGRAFCPIHAAPIRGGELQRHFGSPAPRRKEGLFVCGDGMPQPEKSRACGLPERRSAGGEAGLQWRRPTIFRRRPQPHRAGAMGTPLAGAALQREAK